MNPATLTIQRPLAWVAAFTLAILTPLSAHAWWDTQLKAQTPVPLVQEFSAAQCQGAAVLREDAQADGGQGGKVVYLKPGSELTFQKDFKRGFYSVRICAAKLGRSCRSSPAPMRKNSNAPPKSRGKFH